MVGSVIDGDTLVLEDGTEVRLVGIQAPKPPLGWPATAPWRLAGKARTALADLTEGARVRLHFGGRRGDRYGRHLAHLERSDGLWIQGAMLRQGLARVYSFADNRALIGDMLALEREARARSLGIWNDPHYRIRDPQEVAEYVGGFQLVEGVVVDSALIRRVTYLNFGADWRTDFTVRIAPAAGKLFAKAGLDPLLLKGKRIRVRGWIKSWNGPMIEPSHPGQIEILWTAPATSSAVGGTQGALK